MRSIATLAAWVAITLGACSQAGEARTAEAQTSAEPTAAERAKTAEWLAAPAHPTQPPVGGCTGSEDPAVCASDRARFRDKEWPAAWKGDTAAARAVAYCLISSCDGGVQLNPVLGCAWREVIVAGGGAAVTERDTDDLTNDCKWLGDSERKAAKARAAQIFRDVYGRELAR